jgi:tripartite-type tricarboxylate transporter receptor subunit TctC
VIDKLNNAVVADPLIKARLASLGVDPMSMTSAAFGKFIADETEKWGNVIQALQGGVRLIRRSAAAITASV